MRMRARTALTRAAIVRRLAVVAVVLLGATLLVPVSPAAAAPSFRIPFRCGETWNGYTRSDHSPAPAIDFNGSGISGKPVAASAPGTVTVVQDLGSSSYGKWVEIDHGGGYRTRYAHLSSFGSQMTVGARVQYGTRVGLVGSTGNSTGPHLHYEQRLNGNPVRATFAETSVLYYGNKNYTSGNECGANPYSPEMACGAGYQVINSARLGSATDSKGRVYVLYHSNGNNCVVTIKHTSIGTGTTTRAYLEVQGGTRTTDSGSFGYYAGPVRRAAPATCIKWGGAAGGVGYDSAWSHCG